MDALSFVDSIGQMIILWFLSLLQLAWRKNLLELGRNDVQSKIYSILDVKSTLLYISFLTDHSLIVSIGSNAHDVCDFNTSGQQATVMKP